MLSLKKLYKSLKISNIDFSEYRFSVNIKRTNRSSLSLIVKDAKLSVRCHYLTSNFKIKKIITDKRDWITKKIQLQIYQKKVLENQSRENIFLIYGEKKKLTRRNCSKEYIRIKDNEIVVFGKNVSNREAKKKVIEWYKKSSVSIIKKKIEFYSNIMGIKVNNFFVKDYRSKWGLCSSKKKEIFLNWRLVMAPVSVINYVVVHELCHIIEANHSKNFWNEVERILPDFKKDRVWLKKNGFLLFF